MPSSLVRRMSMSRRKYNRDMSEPEPVVRLTRAQVREIDRRAIEEYHIPGIVLMENAARGVADGARGNNGGDGLAVARPLHNRGAFVQVAAGWANELRGDALTNLRIVEAM